MTIARPPSAIPDWQDEAAYAALRLIDRAGLMWEWLRRDADYIAWHLAASGVTTGERPDPSAWGVHFRRRSDPGRA